ncbi:BZ3500_MvSof-1268-A1-R1_Chr7-3g09683 [Microbotryum saponariae]|uniref:BZ3500_MvSof-1268-A1-R1_Chr7-3g09683 protein n=1 Tax=Microbotryum saponariae TaxID=289078 RepID=A0A2X0MUP0_9BASI|nr:BZ3501_MvSof-1269-A2-R1_Chr7-2g09406 [Microbotryum saponariae]SDA02407.1 BZ3500_MvSof-1268-A1-R1_Chr7-3g09683 [Microbotryum saponariae]
MGELEEEWEALALKTREFVQRRSGVGESEVDALVTKAETISVYRDATKESHT